jgi:hypothetical protein
VHIDQALYAPHATIDGGAWVNASGGAAWDTFLPFTQVHAVYAGQEVQVDACTELFSVTAVRSPPTRMYQCDTDEL